MWPSSILIDCNILTETSDGGFCGEASTIGWHGEETITLFNSVSWYKKFKISGMNFLYGELASWTFHSDDGLKLTIFND